MQRYESTVDLPATLTRMHEEYDTTNAPDLHPVTNATIGAFAAAGIALAAVALQDATGRDWTLLFAALVGLIAFMIYFTLLLVRQSQLGFRIRRTETPVYPDGPATRIMVADAARPRTILTAGYDVTPGGMMRLARGLQRANWRFRRDTVRAARALPAAAIDDWPETIRRFQNAGIIDDAGNVTATGRTLFTEHLPAPPTFYGTRNGSPLSPPEWNGGEGGNGHRGRGVL